MGRDDLIERLEKLNPWSDIDWPETVREAVAELKAAEAERGKLEISRSAWEDSARINRLRAEQAEADLTAARAEIERLKSIKEPQ